MSHLWVNHNLLGIWYIRREITLTAEMHTERVAWHIVNHKHKFALHWMQCLLCSVSTQEESHSLLFLLTQGLPLPQGQPLKDAHAALS